MKLFVWDHPLGDMYGDSVAFAVAESVEQARDILRKAPSYCSGWEDGRVGDATYELGEPSRIIDIPGGECDWWSE